MKIGDYTLNLQEMFLQDSVTSPFRSFHNLLSICVMFNLVRVLHNIFTHTQTIYLYLSPQ